MFLRFPQDIDDRGSLNGGLQEEVTPGLATGDLRASSGQVHAEVLDLQGAGARLLRRRRCGASRHRGRSTARLRQQATTLFRACLRLWALMVGVHALHDDRSLG